MSTDEDQTDRSPDPPPGNGAPGKERPGYGRQAGPPASEDEGSLRDILLVLTNLKALIGRTGIV